MRSFKLKIADYVIGFEADADGPDLAVDRKFLKYISTEEKYDLNIKVHRGKYILSPAAEEVFHAPFVEEKDGILVQNSPDFWSIWKHNSCLYIRTILPLSETMKNALLRFSLSEKEWDLWIDCGDNDVYPLEYPLDGLILYYLTVINKDIMIHASGVSKNGGGFLFTGVSGRGKSTLGKIWSAYGSQVIHDDRLILRKMKDGYRMYNTPVYASDFPQDSVLNKVFVIEHGTSNITKRIKEAAAVSQIMANCIQHSWNAQIIRQLLESVSDMCSTLPAYKLFFRPDEAVIDHILNSDERL